jgi:hypothetical protein
MGYRHRGLFFETAQADPAMRSDAYDVPTMMIWLSAA